MTNVYQIAWQRFNIISSIVSDAAARVVAIVFYFSVLVPFGVMYTLTGDPMRKNAAASWLEREPVDNDIDSARLQG
jgi:hypothetical protein